MRSFASSVLSLSLLALAGCGPEPPARSPDANDPPPAPPAQVAAPALPGPGEECATMAACVAAGEAAVRAKHLDEAARFFGKACDKGDGDACTAAAQALTDRPGGAKGREVMGFLEKGCAASAAGSCNGMGQLAHKAGQEKEAAEWFDKGCAAGNGAACHNLGVLLQSGAIPRDDQRLAAVRERACKAGEQEDCAPLAPATPSKPAPGGVQDANLKVSAMEVDGVILVDLACKVDGLGVLGAMVIGGTLAKQRAALEACGMKDPVPVHWSLRGGKVVDAGAASGDKKRDACVVRALKQIRSTDDGMCSAKVTVK